jgi:uncharacterized membrane protein YhaH (DUF805 family)
MSKPVFEDLFKFSGRRNRQSYILLLLAQIVALIGLSVAAMIAVFVIDQFAPLGYLVMLAVLVGFIAVCVSGWANGSQRIRDFGHSGVWILATLVPYVGFLVSLAIIFIPGTQGDNRYGPDQLKPQLST